MELETLQQTTTTNVQQTKEDNEKQPKIVNVDLENFNYDSELENEIAVEDNVNRTDVFMTNVKYYWNRVMSNFFPADDTVLSAI